MVTQLHTTICSKETSRPRRGWGRRLRAQADSSCSTRLGRSSTASRSVSCAPIPAASAQPSGEGRQRDGGLVSNWSSRSPWWFATFIYVTWPDVKLLCSMQLWNLLITKYFSTTIILMHVLSFHYIYLSSMAAHLELHILALEFWFCYKNGRCHGRHMERVAKRTTNQSRQDRRSRTCIIES
jgi:hypothetical protein